MSPVLALRQDGAAGCRVVRSLVDMAADGAAAVCRRLEPELVVAMRGLRCLLQQRMRLIVHASDEDVGLAPNGRRTGLPLLDGAPWKGTYVTKDAG